MADAVTPLIVHRAQPLNAEPTLESLRRSFITPRELFYIRTHGTMPALSSADHKLRIRGRVTEPRDFSLDDLRSRFAVRTVTAVLQCAGNRRAQLASLRPVSGDLWEGGAIGNAVWTGVSLADVLREAGCADDALHVEFVSCDQIDMNGEQFPYAVSIPLTKAMSPEVLLAWDMDGSPLAREHGFPLRVIVPGYAGVRSAKWLVAVNVLSTASDNYMQQRDYKFFPSSSREDSADWEHAITINMLPLNSAICEPERHAERSAGPLTIRGYAIASGASTVERVDVSQDGGRTWQPADLEKHSDSPWSWTPWEITLDLPVGEHELAVRAWDNAGQTQPPLPDDVWNFKGYLNASWHRIPVRIR